MYYRWGPYFEADCQDPEYVKQLREIDAYQTRIREEQLQPLDLSESQQLRFTLVCNTCGTRTYHSDYMFFFQGIDSHIIANQSRRKCPYCGATRYQLFVEPLL